MYIQHVVCLRITHCFYCCCPNWIVNEPEHCSARQAGFNPSKIASSRKGPLVCYLKDATSLLYNKSLNLIFQIVTSHLSLLMSKIARRRIEKCSSQKRLLTYFHFWWTCGLLHNKVITSLYTTTRYLITILLLVAVDSWIETLNLYWCNVLVHQRDGIIFKS